MRCGRNRVAPLWVEELCTDIAVAVKEVADVTLWWFGVVAPQVVCSILICNLHCNLCCCYNQFCLAKDCLSCCVCSIECCACLGKQCGVLEADSSDFGCRKCAAVNLNTGNGAIESLACTLRTHTAANVDVCVGVVCLYHCGCCNFICVHETVRVSTGPCSV